MKKFLVSLLAATMIMAGCSNSNQTVSSSTPESSSYISSVEEEKGTRIFVDSCGREVEIPTVINKVSPTGVPAQLALLTACPDKLVGIARDFTAENKAYLPEKFGNFTVFGQFYGKNANLNMEALLGAKPDVIIDLGEAKGSIKEDMDGLQKQLGIPVVFIEASMTTYDETYKMLGSLLGTEDTLKSYSEYATEVINKAKTESAKLTDDTKKTVYMALGENGLQTNAAGSFHAQVLDIIGATNIAQLDVGSTGGSNEVSFEQLLNWNPDYIITDKDTTYELINSDEVWSTLEAVKAGRVYKIPTAPFNCISDPPSVNRLLGVSWLGNLLYPESYEFSREAFKSFSEKFYHTSLTDAHLDEILKYSLAK